MKNNKSKNHINHCTIRIINHLLRAAKVNLEQMELACWRMGRRRKRTTWSGRRNLLIQAGLDNKILVRESHSEYPATGSKPKITHNDLNIIYPDYTGNPVKAIYFDNDGHTINYSISYADKSIALTSEKIPNVPVFRLTYTLLENEIVNTKFEISQDGEKFTTYY